MGACNCVSCRRANNKYHDQHPASNQPRTKWRGKAYALEPSGIQFKKPVQLIFPYSEEESEECPADAEPLYGNLISPETNFIANGTMQRLNVQSATLGKYTLVITPYRPKAIKFCTVVPGLVDKRSLSTVSTLSTCQLSP